MSPGYQVAQTAHSIAEYAAQKTRVFKRWHKRSGYLISLAVQDLQALDKLKQVLDKYKIEYVPFTEPDIGELTGLVLTPSKMADHITKYLNLAGKKAGVKDKHEKKE